MPGPFPIIIELKFTVDNAPKRITLKNGYTGIPSQLSPFILYPVSQLHSKLPTVSLQMELAPQGFVPPVHSSVSGDK